MLEGDWGAVWRLNCTRKRSLAFPTRRASRLLHVIGVIADLQAQLVPCHCQEPTDYNRLLIVSLGIRR